MAGGGAGVAIGGVPCVRVEIGIGRVHMQVLNIPIARCARYRIFGHVADQNIDSHIS